MDFQGWKWIKIVVFCVAFVVVKACVWRGKGVYDQYVGAPPKFSSLFVLGDSLAECGNNNYINTSVAARANFAPYGRTFFGTPTGRFSDGRTIFDFLASRIGVRFPSPWFQSRVDLVTSEGANFASAGSGLLDSTFQHLNVISFGRQVNEFRDAFDMLRGVSGYSAQQMLSESLIAINIGANDIAGNYLANSSLNHNVRPQAFIQSLLKIYKHDLLKLHEIGGRKFIVFGIGPLGCSPGMRYAGLAKWKGGCDETANEMFQQFNLGLKKLIRHLNRNLIGSTFLYVNTYDLVLDIINNGETLGFSEIGSACCGEGQFNAGVGCGQKSEKSVCEDASRYIFWDSFHPTEAVQKIIAEEVWGGKSSVFPTNLRNVINSPASSHIPFFSA